MSKIEIKRTKAAELIENIRARLSLAVHKQETAQFAINDLLSFFEDANVNLLEPCIGEAHLVGEGHANGYTDRCPLCQGMPWGWTGSKIVIK